MRSRLAWPRPAAIPTLLAWLALLAAPISPTQAQSPAAFGAVSIKEYRIQSDSPMPLTVIDPSGFRMVNNLRTFIEMAYGINDDQLLGGEGWTGQTWYYIDASTSAPATNDQELLMLRKALADRFGLTLSREKRTVPGYALVAVPNGLKIEKLADDKMPSTRYVNPIPGECPFRSWPTLARFTQFLNYKSFSLLDRPVVDKTGLNGRYNIALYLPCDANRKEDLGGLVPAIRDQLGLILKPTKITMDFLRIVSVHPPTPN